jgi:chromosome segregation ATPase
LLKYGREWLAGLLESLTAKLAEADSDLCDAKSRVAELQEKLANATGRVAAAEQAASVADAEKRQMEARLSAAIADANDGRAIVQDLTAELARCVAGRALQSFVGALHDAAGDEHCLRLSIHLLTLHLGRQRYS